MLTISKMDEKLKKYYYHKNGAKQRGIGFHLSFDEWCKLWEPYWEKRGVKRGQYVMCRYKDLGDYEIGNVRIDLVENNIKDRRDFLAIKNPPARIKSFRAKTKRKPELIYGMLDRPNLYEYGENEDGIPIENRD